MATALRKILIHCQFSLWCPLHILFPEEGRNSTVFPLTSCFSPPVAFRLYDLDKDDKISRDELLQVCGRAPVHVDDCLGPACLFLRAENVPFFTKHLFHVCMCVEAWPR